MKLKSKLICVALSGMALFSCEEEKLNTVLNPESVFSVDPIALTVPAEGGEVCLNINGNEAWTLEVEETNTSRRNWFTFDQTSGQGPAVVKISVTPSSSFTKNRRLLLSVAGEGGTVLNAVVLQATQVLGENEVLINGLVWSTVNVDTPGTFCASPDDLGHWYQFNSKVPWPSTGATSGWDSSKYEYSEDSWQDKNDPSPEGWRVPTGQEIADLVAKGCVWASASQTGYKVPGVILGIPEEQAKTATKETIKSLGGIFLPRSGWINAEGNLDRTWLVACRTATSLNKTMGGMYLRDSGGYQDLWGWGDGQKERAAMIRPVKKLEIEE